MQEQKFVELRWVVAVVRRWWWLIAGLGLLAGGITFVLVSMKPPVYGASVTMLINPSRVTNTDQYAGLLAGQQLALTYSEMVKDQPVLEAAIQKLGLKMTPADLEKKVLVELVRNTQLIRLTVTDSNPQQTVIIANALSEAFAQHVEELSTKRYAESIQNTKKQLENLQAQLKDNQAQVDVLRSQQVEKQVNLAYKESLLNSLQNDYQILVNSSQNLQVSLADATGRVYIVDPARVHENVKTNAYTATTVISVGQQTTDPSNVALTYGSLMLKPDLLEGVIKELGLQVTADDLAKQLSVDLVPNTRLVRLTVDDKDDVRAQKIAHSVVNAFVTELKGLFSEPYSDQLKSLQDKMDAKSKAIADTQSEIAALTSENSQLSGNINRLDNIIAELRNDIRISQQTYDQAKATAADAMDAVVITEPAQTPTRSSQSRLSYTLLVGVIGMVIAAVVGFLFTYLDDRIKNSEEVRSALNLHVLGTIGQMRSKGNELVMNSQPASLIAEDFRLLSNKVRLIKEHDTLHTILVTSPAQAEGKSVIVSNLAISLSRMGLQVVIVDADLHLPRLHELFELEQMNGLTRSLTKGHIDGTVQYTEKGDVKVITSGELPSNPAEVLSSSPLSNLLEELKEKSDIVLIDCPPVLAAVDTSILASKVDGVLLVLRAGQSEMKAAREALEALQQVKANVIGIILNAMPERKGAYHKYYRKAETKM